MSVMELRLVVTVTDLDAAVDRYRDVLGMPEVATIDDGAGRVVILDAGHATLELTDQDHAVHIDRVEVGRRVAGSVRMALRVADVDETTQALVDDGAGLIAAPTETPWGSRNARLDGPTAGLQLTLFEQDDDVP